MNSDAWQVPRYEVAFWDGRLANYCVVIPVINEGTRIANLLKRMESLKLAELVDIIIIDGGSTDGSLAMDLMKSLRVRGVLCKRGPGRLSAQLRCAYSFALKQGYLGIVTIDGNDKDDPEAIPRFLEALDRGVDFVQGSRFVFGGVAVNTPMSRYFAIRAIHAPLLSICSGFHWTDTTQGFRAYSRQLLLDPAVAPFRDVFSDYELLAYLSYRAPRLGFRCIELATSRVYPKGTVPTKISVLRGNAKVFRTLLRACTGQFNPTLLADRS